MMICFSPLEGLTDAIYRRVHHGLFPGVDKYIMPFVSPSSALSFTSRQQADISPAENAGVPAVPQVLAKNPDYFLDMARLLKDAGYGEVNLNLGCPSGTVTGKGKGAAMLRDRDVLRAFLDRVYEKSPLPVSLKTRAGYDSPAEWEGLLEIFIQYPVSEWILHPRTCRELYYGHPHRDFYAQARAAAPFPVIYNGDIFTIEDYQGFVSACPAPFGLALGRGMAVNPALAREIKSGEKLTMEDLRSFHDHLYREYLKSWPEHAVVGRMHGVMHYLTQAMDCPPPLLRALRKSTGAEEYTDAAARVFATAQVKAEVRFIPPGQEGAAL